MLAYFLFAITAVTGALAWGGPLELEPALTLKIGIEYPIVTGPVIQGYDLSYTHCPNGTIISEPGAEVSINATVVMAGAVVRADPDGGRLRLTVHGLARTIGGTNFQFSYTAISTPDEEFTKVLNRAPDARDNDFGAIFSHHTFEIPVAAPELAPLNNKVYAGAGRLLINAERIVTVEYRLSKLVVGNERGGV